METHHVLISMWKNASFALDCSIKSKRRYKTAFNISLSDIFLSKIYLPAPQARHSGPLASGACGARVQNAWHQILDPKIPHIKIPGANQNCARAPGLLTGGIKWGRKNAFSAARLLRTCLGVPVCGRLLACAWFAVHRTNVRQRVAPPGAFCVVLIYRAFSPLGMRAHRPCA